MSKTKWRTPYSQLIKALKNSAIKKRKAGWSDQVGAGFIPSDITSVRHTKNGLRIRFGWCAPQTTKIKDLNLRETERILDWAERKEVQWEYNKRHGKGGTEDEERISRYKKYMRGKKKKWTEAEKARYLAPRMR